MFLQQLMSGFALGCVYGLVALGFVLIYKATDVLNFAQGELMVVGAFMAYTFITYLHLPFWLSFMLSLVFMAVFGMVLERLFMRPLLGEPVFAMVIAIQTGVRLVYMAVQADTEAALSQALHETMIGDAVVKRTA